MHNRDLIMIHMIKIMARISLIIVAVVGVLVILLVGSVAIDFAAGRSRLDAVTNTTIPGIDGSPNIRAYVARPQGNGPFPTVIMIHEFYGLNESIVGKAQGLAQEGYFVIAPDTFRGSTTAWIPRAIYQVITTRSENVNQDLDAVYAWIGAQPEADPVRTAVLGFCYGGRTSLQYSLHNNRLAATVIFYGSPVTDPEILKSLPGPVLGIFGGADNSISLDEVNAFENALQQAGVPHQVTIYEGQPHAFLTDMQSIRAGGVQAEAWGEMLAFLDANLKQGGASLTPPQPTAYLAPFNWGYYWALAVEHAFGMAHQH